MTSVKNIWIEGKALADVKIHAFENTCKCLLSVTYRRKMTGNSALNKQLKTKQNSKDEKKKS